MPPRKPAAKVVAAATSAPDGMPVETEANPGPVAGPSSPVIEATNTTVDMDDPSRLAPDDQKEEYDLPADQPMEEDLPGPSSTYIPRQPSPPLPSLRHRPFPPENDHADFDNDNDDDDEVIAKLPIYLSPALYPNLHVFQYPLHHKSLNPPTWARDRGKEVTTRVKEKVGRVEVEIPVDGGQSVWRDERARDLGFVADVNAVNGHGDDVVGGYGFGGRSKDKDKESKKEKKKKKAEKWGDKTRYRSEIVPNATGYYSGVVHDGALHLHPISKVMQFRTSFAYLDDLDTANKERAARRSREIEEDEDGPRPRAAAAQPPRPMTRKMPQDEENDGSGSIKDFRNKMWNTAADEEADQWVQYAWSTDNDSRVAASLQQLHISENKRERLDCHTKGLDYLNR